MDCGSAVKKWEGIREVQDSLLQNSLALVLNIIAEH
jgi:hypothetical protein